METALPFIWIVASLALLALGAEGLVRGSVALALKFGVPPLLVGLTVVAYGTSAPEMVVSVKAALGGQGALAIGNVVGSNSFNLGLILGLTALICPIKAQLQVIKLDVPVMIGVAALGVALLWDGRVGRLEGLLLIACLLAYTMANVVLARRSPAPEVEEGLPRVATGKSWVNIGYIAAGLVCLVLGSSLLVENASLLARSWGVSEAVIGLTIVSAGTSMPELATSVVAALRRQPDIAIGNVVGSNIFNLLGILGVASLVSPLQSQGVATSDLLVMLGFSLLALPLLWTGLLLRRAEGAILLCGYAAYLWWLWP